MNWAQIIALGYLHAFTVTTFENFASRLSFKFSRKGLERVECPQEGGRERLLLEPV